MSERNKLASELAALQGLGKQGDISQLGTIIAEIMRPVMQGIGKMLENNTEAVERLASAQTVQNNRLEALEKQIRLQTPVSSKQANYLNEAIRGQARAMLLKRDVEDKRAVIKLCNAIRKSVLMRYGVASLREIPQHEYTVAMRQIEMWDDFVAVRDVVKEARERAEQQAAMDEGAE